MPHQNAHPHTQPNRKKPGFENEGEGNKTAARNYDEQTERYIESGSVEHAAREAKQALEGAEREELRKAEEIGREGEPRIAHADPSLDDTRPDGKNARKH
jgi:hypothetical protein